MAGGRKEIAFDLDTKNLQKYYPNKNWRAAYGDIKKFFDKNGFDWRQGSLYVSRTSTTFSKVSKVLDRLSKDKPWLALCVRDCTVTNVGKIHDQTYIFSKEKIMAEIEEKKKQYKQPKFKHIEKEEEEEI